VERLAVLRLAVAIRSLIALPVELVVAALARVALLAAVSRAATCLRAAALWQRLVAGLGSALAVLVARVAA
jgi:hypothetical protein